MTTYRLQFSSHASASFSNGSQVGMFVLYEEKLEVKYFVQPGEILDYDISIEIYNELVNNELDRVNKKVRNTKFYNSEVTDYVMWDLENPNYVSGSLIVGENTPIVDIAGTTFEKPIRFLGLLRQTLRELGANKEDEIIVYFNACRE